MCNKFRFSNKKKKLISITLILLILLSTNIKSIYADEETNKSQSNETSVVGKKLDVDLSNLKVDDTFKSYTNTEYRVTQVEGSNIKINGKKLDIYNFEISTTVNGEETWRKFVKLNDLCTNNTICKLVKDQTDIVLQRTNSLDKKIVNDNNEKQTVYYETKYYGDKKEFQPLLIIGEDTYAFNSNNDKSSSFTKDGILTSDVETLTDKNGDLYVSLRFVTEALGAEVVWTASKSNDKDTVEINFYDYTNYCTNIEITSKIDKNNLSKNTNIEYNYTDYDGNKNEFASNLAEKGIFYSGDKKYTYVLLMYKSVPILYNLDDNTLKTGPNICVNEKLAQKSQCDGEWITDEAMIKLTGGDSAYCAINLSSQVKTRN